MSFGINPRVYFILEEGELSQEIEHPQFPLVDMYISQGCIYLELEIPGVEPQEVSLTLEGAQLIIEGIKRERGMSPKPLSFIRMERFSGPFKRYISLPQSIDREKVTATYKKGVLYVKIPIKTEDGRVEIEGED